jgi:hypothetical protein
MKRQLLSLQQLLGVMDPQLHRHLGSLQSFKKANHTHGTTENADGLNLFFCFRWILIGFKREFPFDEVLRLWDVGSSDAISGLLNLKHRCADIVDRLSIQLFYAFYCARCSRESSRCDFAILGGGAFIIPLISKTMLTDWPNSILVRRDSQGLNSAS